MESSWHLRDIDTCPFLRFSDPVCTGVVVVIVIICSSSSSSSSSSGGDK